jgi:hypothetical protein
MLPVSWLLTTCWLRLRNSPFVPLIMLCLAISCFFRAVQLPPPSFARRAFTILHVLGAITALTLSRSLPSTLQHLLVPSVILGTLRTVLIVCIEHRTIPEDGALLCSWHRWQQVYRASANLRELQFSRDKRLEHNPSHDAALRTRLCFALFRCGRAAIFLTIHRLGTTVIVRFLLLLRAVPSDFFPDKQGLLPTTTPRELCLRALFSYQWIWSNYLHLSGAHDLLAVFFVTILRFDHPSEWPPIFGNLADARSLRLFWGKFWHRLHVPLYDAYLSTAMTLISGQAPFRKGVASGTQGNTGAALSPQIHHGQYVLPRKVRALAIFCMSATLHAASNSILTDTSNLAAEFRFFLSNYVLCLAETLCARWLRRGLLSTVLPRTCWCTQAAGYAWVILAIFLITPAWQYPLARAAAG